MDVRVIIHTITLVYFLFHVLPTRSMHTSSYAYYYVFSMILLQLNPYTLRIVLASLVCIYLTPQVLLEYSSESLTIQ